MFAKIVYEDKGITAITVEWRNDVSEVLNVLNTFFNDNNTEHLLLDFRDSPLDAISHDHISDLYWYAISRTNNNDKNIVNGKTAFVCSNGLQIEMGKIFNTYSEMIEPSIKVSAFRSEEKALSWLEEG
jgi:hypothetical protein